MEILIILVNIALFYWSFLELSKNNHSFSFVFLAFISAVWIGVCGLQLFGHVIEKGFQFTESFGSRRDKVLKDSKIVLTANRLQYAPVRARDWEVSRSQILAAARFNTAPKSCWF